MKNPRLLSVGAFVVGVLALVVGLLYQTEALGHHPTRALAAFVAGAILVLAGLAVLVIGRSRGRA